MSMRIVVLVCVLFSAASLRAATTLLPYGADWLYFDDGYLPAGNWAQFGFDDSDWKEDLAQFGYGDGDEATVVNYGPDDEHKYVTTYFRTHVSIVNLAQYESIAFSLIRDDGAVVYVNGTEVFRDNLPEDEIFYDTYALTGLTFGQENTPVSVVINSSAFLEGDNLIAVEVHQFEPSSPDLSFDLKVVGNGGNGSGSVIRGPYLQVGTSSNVVVRWRTSLPTSTRVRYGLTAGNLDLSASDPTSVTDHEIIAGGLLPNTKYYYDIGTTSAALAGDSTYFFYSSPLPGTPKPTRIWAIGDFGTGFPDQTEVRDAYMNFTGARNTDVWLMLGDNAYEQGLDYEYQAHVFNVYPTLMRQAVIWPTIGNHETATGDQSLRDDYDYYTIFTMPRSGQAGGVASGTEHYYSFDYANVHFVCLDSQTQIYRQPNSAMLQWLAADLGNTTRDWIIAFFHHPPYTRGTHTSDGETDLIEMRMNVVPVLEAYGVDLVLSGHSHTFERSYLIDGFYGMGATASAVNFIDHGNGRTNGTGAYVKSAGGSGRRGAVYVVDGSSGGRGAGGFLNHPAMAYSALTSGSMVIDVDGQRLDAKFLSDSGSVDDSFTILKQASLQIARAGTNTSIVWPVTSPPYQLESKTLVNGPVWTPVGGIVSTNGRRKSTIVPATGPQKFFQLRAAP